MGMVRTAYTDFCRLGFNWPVTTNSSKTGGQAIGKMVFARGGNNGKENK